MFESIFKDGTTLGAVLIAVFSALVFGIIFSFIVSRKLRSSKGLLITVALIPAIVGAGVALIAKYMSDADSTTNVARVATIAIALGLLRFRSNNGRAEEMLMLLTAVVAGFVYGLGYIAYASLFNVLIGVLYVCLSSASIFKNKRFEREKTLKITVPESLNYSDMFERTFEKYLKESEAVGVKTTDMGSMFKLTYRVVFIDAAKEKEFIDELRTKNGNLEISILPYVESERTL